MLDRTSEKWKSGIDANDVAFVGGVGKMEGSVCCDLEGMRTEIGKGNARKKE
jgi:hypothetical protein